MLLTSLGRRTPLNKPLNKVFKMLEAAHPFRVKSQIVALAKKFPMSKTNLVHSQNTPEMSLGAT